MATAIQERAQAEGRAYAGREVRPLGGYMRVMGTYGAAVSVASLLLRRTGKRLPDRVEPYDLALLAIATHKASRMLTKEAVTSPLRAPFTRFEGVSGPNELSEQVRHPDGVKHAVGELLTCPFCIAQWLATGFGFGLIVAPRLTRMVAAVLAVRAGSDVLQYGYAIAQQRAAG
jgi:hypothetical protein